jgi:palmitoyltransferase
MYPYDQGVLNNIKAVLGQQPLLWLWPRQMEGSGFSFPVNITRMHGKGNPVAAIEENGYDKDTRSSMHSTWTARSADDTQYDDGNHSGDIGDCVLSMDGITPQIPNTYHQPALPPVPPIPIQHQYPSSSLQSKSSTNTLHTPTTPGSITTFASTASTLVDSKSKRHSTRSNGHT